jgi:hypothetical protein
MAELVMSLDFSCSSWINRGCCDLFSTVTVTVLWCRIYAGTGAKTVDTRDSTSRLRLYSTTTVPLQEPPTSYWVFITKLRPTTEI